MFFPIKTLVFVGDFPGTAGPPKDSAFVRGSCSPRANYWWPPRHAVFSGRFVYMFCFFFNVLYFFKTMFRTCFFTRLVFHLFMTCFFTCCLPVKLRYFGCKSTSKKIIDLVELSILPASTRDSDHMAALVRADPDLSLSLYSH
jgi:hypothetical protein